MYDLIMFGWVVLLALVFGCAHAPPPAPPTKAKLGLTAKATLTVTPPAGCEAKK